MISLLFNVGNPTDPAGSACAAIPRIDGLKGRMGRPQERIPSPCPIPPVHSPPLWPPRHNQHHSTTHPKKTLAPEIR